MNRRGFAATTALAGTAALLGVRPDRAHAEPPAETRRIRMAWSATLCFAPQYVAEELLRAESFGLGMNFIRRVDAGDPIAVLAGGHVGCFELFGSHRVRAITDLKGKTVAVPGLGLGPHMMLSVMLAHVGVDPRRDVHWRTLPWSETPAALTEEKVDAFMGFPPEPQELRARKIGHVVVDTGAARPWSQYFCCMIAGHREFVRKHPVAAKRALRAILKATDLCGTQPDSAARVLVERGYSTNVDLAAQVLRDIPYRRWREYSPEDTVRFYALRMHELGVIKTNPQKILAQGTDWRFLNELKKELKA